MAKDFNVPPVIFPFGGNPSGLHKRRIQTTPFLPLQTPTPTPTPFIPTPPSTSSFPNEPPLLEELGINTTQIYQKTLSILNPFRPKPDLHVDADLSGPFLSILAFGLLQLMAGKLHFGIILGWVSVASLFIYVVFNMLAGRNGNLDLYKCVSLIGYCLLMIVILSAVSLFVPQGGVVIMAMAGVFTIWSSRVCTRLLVELALCGDEHRGLIAYPCFLVYVMFSLLVVF